jgi:hypothetical protein
MKPAKLFLAIAFILMAFSLKAQNYLTQKMSLAVINDPLSVAFEKLESKGQFNFSFHADIIDLSKKVVINTENRSLKKILNQLLGNKFRYKVVGSHVLIQRKRQYETSINESVRISGQLKDKSNQPVSNAIIYDPNSKRTIITNVEGRFNIKLDNKGNPLLLSLNAQHFQDTIVYFNSAHSHIEFTINQGTTIERLEPLEHLKPASVQSSSFNNLKLVKFFIPNKNRYVAEKLNVFQRGALQMSLVPTVGTNTLSKGRTTNSFSLNIVAGYNYAINGLEIGSAANFIQQDLRGVQMAGAINVTGENVNGVQIAGGINKAMGKVSGTQISGGTNLANTQLNGMQIAGGFNLAGNSSYTESNGFNGQIAGGVNINRLERTNLQISGGVNKANSVKGTQVSSLYNEAEEIDGLQLTALLNKTRKLNGLQLGIVNYADTIENGLQFGLINIVKSGYRKLELSTNETFHFNVAYKTGGRFLYSTLKTGGGKYLHAGYGIGMIFRKEKTASFNIDYIASAVFNTRKGSDFFLGNMTKIHFDINLKLNKKLQLFAGPSFNFFVPQTNNENGLASYTSFTPGIKFINKAIATNKTQNWWGWHLGFKI